MDASDSLFGDWQDLDVTKDDLKLIAENLKNEKFRDLLADYAKEVNDPENRKLYEEELTLLEKQRGVDVTFVKPEPGYVVKSSANGDTKCFLNVSQSDVVGKPTSEPSHENGNRGLKWSIPYTLTPPRGDLDRKGRRCVVVDVVFHPDTLHLASKNGQFRDIVNNTAIDGVENYFKMKLDRKNLKFPKMSYKGTYQPSVIRTPCEKSETRDAEIEMDPEIYQKLMTQFDETRERQCKKFADKPRRPSPATKYFSDKDQKVNEAEQYSKPKYVVTYQSDVDMADYTTDKNSKLLATVPKTLVITIDLPLLRSAEDANLDVQDRLLILQSERPAKYYLKLPLYYIVDPNKGSAKFELKSKKLIVTLPVIRNLLCPEDSGVDSDNGSSPVHEIMNDLKLDSENIAMSYDDGNAVLISDEGTSNSVDEEEIANNGKESKQGSVSIMEPDVRYILPVFFCNVFENILAVTVNVKNVETGSIKHRILENDSGFHVVLKSVGSGFFPSYYSLCMKIRENIVDPEILSIEPWDNNVVLTVTLKDTENLLQYNVGLDDSSMETKYFSSIETVKKKLEDITEPTEEAIKNVQVRKEEDSIIININPRSNDSEDEDRGRDRDREEEFSQQQETNWELFKSRTLISESSGDELPSNPRGHKGILKSHREFSRSVSESSIDDGIVHTPSINFNYDSAQEINSESECANLKKTVRFNDVVSKQLYRSNSSILGQRRKNQRKVRNKKRAFERRMSESENSETEEREKYKVQPKTQESRME